MIAILIFIISALTSVALIGQVLSYSSEANRVLIASNLAEKKIEEIRNTPYELIASGQDEDQAGNRIWLDEYGNPGGQYLRSWEVTQDVPIQGTKTIVVTVQWESGRTFHELSITTIVARPFDIEFSP